MSKLYSRISLINKFIIFVALRAHTFNLQLRTGRNHFLKIFIGNSRLRDRIRPDCWVITVLRLLDPRVQLVHWDILALGGIVDAAVAVRWLQVALARRDLLHTLLG